MSDKQIKWLILIIPALTIGLWEYLRHGVLLPYISMEFGNWLSPVIVLFATTTFGWLLFQRYDQLHKQLEQERAEREVLQERERIARELHDGIAQTLFLCSVQVQKLQPTPPTSNWTELEKSLRQIHQYIRQSIYSLKKQDTPVAENWNQQMRRLIHQFQMDTGLVVHTDWKNTPSTFSSREKIELQACLQEALTNIKKHAQAQQVEISFHHQGNGWRLCIQDDGVGLVQSHCQPHHLGLKIMKERIKELQAQLTISSQNTGTQIVIEKEGDPNANSHR